MLTNCGRLGRTDRRDGRKSTARKVGDEHWQDKGPLRRSVMRGTRAHAQRAVRRRQGKRGPRRGLDAGQAARVVARCILA